MTEPKAADYAEALEILTQMARNGDVRAAIALAGHLAKQSAGSRSRPRSTIDRLAARDDFDEFDALAQRRAA
jgi:hypothetical protein